MTTRYPVPDSLAIKQDTYIRWLRRKAAAHVKRDRKRCAHAITGEDYRRKIHAAVCAHGTHDYYTGQKLDWSLVSTWCNEDSRLSRTEYKAGFALLSTVDHVPCAEGGYDFVICAWRTNDAKNDLGHEDFIALCRRVVAHADRSIKPAA
jgi:hypothetical protein